MTLQQGIDLALAALNLSVAAYVLLRGRHWLGRTSAPMVTLGVYFALRAGARAYDAATASGGGERDAYAVQVALDASLAVTLLVVLVTIGSVIRGIAAREDAARYRAQEYERARRHYEQVVRHRLMNPLTVIRGSAVTLRDEPTVDSITREQLLDAIVDASDALEGVSLVPERRDELERELDAIPRVGRERRRTRFPDRPPGPT